MYLAIPPADVRPDLVRNIHGTVIYIYIIFIIIIGIQPFGRSGQRPEFSQATGMALVRCILGKCLGVACHCFPPLFSCSHFSPSGASTSIYIYIYIYILHDFLFLLKVDFLAETCRWWLITNKVLFTLDLYFFCLLFFPLCAVNVLPFVTNFEQFLR